MRCQDELGGDFDACDAADLDWGHFPNTGLVSRGAEVVEYQIVEYTGRGTPVAWVSEMGVSNGKTEYWVNIGYPGIKFLSNRFHYSRVRAEYEVAEWNHLFGHCEEPDILAVD